MLLEVKDSLAKETASHSKAEVSLFSFLLSHQCPLFFSVLLRQYVYTMNLACGTCPAGHVATVHVALQTSICDDLELLFRFVFCTMDHAVKLNVDRYISYFLRCT